MARPYAFTIGPAESALRIDQFLSRRLPEIISRTTIQRLIRSGRVTVNGSPVKVHYKLRPVDRVAVVVDQLPPKPSDFPLKAQAIALDVVYEDEQVLVVDKPAGLVTHPAPGHWDGTLVNAVLWHLQRGGRKPGDSEQGTEGKAAKEGVDDPESPLPRAGIVHRLDKDTSGLLMVAKTDQALLVLSRQMKARAIHREYLAVVEGHLPADSGTVKAAIGRHVKDRKVMAIRHLGGRHAVTHYRVLKRSSLDLPQDLPQSAGNRRALPCTLATLKLDTGRTHQIRVHMAHLGYPVLGDPVYGARPAAFWQHLGIVRQLLHAFRLSFRHPTTNKWVVLEASIPPDLARFCDPQVLSVLRGLAMRGEDPSR